MKKLVLGILIGGLLTTATTALGSDKTSDDYIEAVSLLNRAKSSRVTTRTTSRASTSNAYFSKLIYEEEIRQTKILKNIEKLLEK